jgi:hypothetical protein
MDITIHLEEEQACKLEYIKQQTNQDVAKVLSRSLTEAINAYYQQIQSDSLDPLVQLRQSKFIGCFKGAPDLAANSEANFKAIYIPRY